MPTLAPQPPPLAHILLYAVFAAGGAYLLFEFVVGKLALYSSWEQWIVASPIGGLYVPVIATAVSCGVLVGVAVGALAGARAYAVAAWAGLGLCVLSFLAASAVGGVRWAVTNPVQIAFLGIAAGLLLGAFLGRNIRRA